MAGESQETPGSQADPTVITTESIVRANVAERDYTNGQLAVLKARLDGMDEATKVLHETVTRTPTDIQKAISHLKELHGEKFDSVQTQFKERDTRQERESRDNKVAVDAAFAAQKEAAAKQDEANSKAIDKSEGSTKEKIDKLTDLFRTEIAGLSQRLDDQKDRNNTTERRVGELGAAKQGGKEQLAAIYALAGFLVALVILGGVLAASGAFGSR